MTAVAAWLGLDRPSRAQRRKVRRAARWWRREGARPRVADLPPEHRAPHEAYAAHRRACRGCP